jgi:hypothetical protein
MNKGNILDAYRRMGKNFVTPDVMDYVQTQDGRIVEIAKGTGLMGEKLWGVSEFKDGESGLQPTGRGQLHYSLISARRYFNILLGSN